MILALHYLYFCGKLLITQDFIRLLGVIYVGVFLTLKKFCVFLKVCCIKKWLEFSEILQ